MVATVSRMRGGFRRLAKRMTPDAGRDKQGYTAIRPS